MNPIDGRSFGVDSYFEFRAKSINASLLRLATGRRINRAADDPAGMIASQNLRAALAALEAESRSLERVDHVASVADGVLASAAALLIEAEGLAVANQNTAGMSAEEIEANQMEIDSILGSVDRMLSSATFGGQALFDGSMTLAAGGSSLSLGAAGLSSIGAIDVNGEEETLASVLGGASLDTTLGEGTAGEAQRSIRAAIGDLSRLRGEIGSFQRHTVQSRLAAVEVGIETTSAAESVIADADYAHEVAMLNRDRTLGHLSLLTMKQSLDLSWRALSLLD
jgi:flagellin-like hook-associated protein FlgL